MHLAALCGSVDLPGLDGQRHTALRTDLEALVNRILDVLHSLVFGLALADTTGNCRTFDDPKTVFVAVYRNAEFHIDTLTVIELVETGKRSVTKYCL